MRTLLAALPVSLAFAIVAALASPSTAHALDLPRTLSMPLPSLPSLDVPRLNLASDVVDIALDMPLQAATPSLVVPPRYGFILDDGRAFWFSAGASSVIALGSHVLLGIPTLAIAYAGFTAMSNSPAVQVPFLLGMTGAYVLAESALAALGATLLFNATSKIYDGNYMVSLAAHVGGALLGLGVSGLAFGIGYLTYAGLNGLIEFTGSAGVLAIGVFSFLGALPAVVIAGIALVGVPALVSSWALSISATTKEGYAVNPAWKDPPPDTSSLEAPRAPTSRSAAVAVPLVTIPLPG